MPRPSPKSGHARRPGDPLPGEDRQKPKGALRFESFQLVGEAGPKRHSWGPQEPSLEAKTGANGGKHEAEIGPESLLGAI